MRAPIRTETRKNEITFEVAMVGNSGVGKTCLAVRYTSGTYDPNNTVATVGIEFSTVKNKINENGLRYNMAIHDTAGQEKFRSLAPGYIKGKDAVIVAFAYDDPESFESVQSWVEIVRSVNVECAIFLVATKADCELKIDRTAINELANGRDSPFAAYMETSASTGSGVDDLFAMITLSEDALASCNRRRNAMTVEL